MDDYPRERGRVSDKGPKILLVTTQRWHSCARLAMAFSEAGCVVDVVCPAGHSVMATSAVTASWVYRPFKPMAGLTRAIAGSSPKLIVPCDDAAIADLHELASKTDDSELRELIEFSIGSEGSYAIYTSRAGIHALADELHVAVPLASRVESEAQFDEAIDTVGLPAFLKTDGSSGGTGVCLVKTVAEARRAYRRLTARPSLLRAVKRVVVDRDWSALPAALKVRQSRLSLQQAITGHEANSTIFCWRGLVMASITVDVVMASMKHGPSTVVRRTENPDIDRATAAIAKSLCLSGVFGFDFVLQQGSGRAMLIEMNARPTQTSHLALGDGRDLAAAAFAALSGRLPAARAAVTQSKLIALFPGEMQRDRASEYLQLAYHDVPTSQPELVRICMRRQSIWRRLLTIQGWKRMRSLLLGRLERAANEPRDTSPGFSADAHPSQVE